MTYHAIVSLVVAFATSWTLAANTPVPFYGQSASGITSPPRGWNSFVAQSNGVTLSVDVVDEQCGFFYNNTNPNVKYVCSFDSGWSSGSNGDEYGRIIPDDTVFSNMSIEDFAAKLHSNGMKLGVYMIPGAFTNDANKTVKGTNITIGSLFNTTEDGRTGISNSYNARNDFDYAKTGVQEWHDSVVELFNSWDVDFVKLDYVTPGSDYLEGTSGDTKPANDSASVACMHNAIMKYAPNMELDISWKLEREQPFWDLWQHNADTIRVDRDINFGPNPVTWGPTQRTIEQYRVFINQQVLDSTRQNKPIMIRPDMDNLLVATPNNSSAWSGYSTIERYAQTILWIGAGANLINGCDMTKVDDLVPKNPSSSQDPGGPNASQLQAWIAGPDDNGTAVVILSNLGPDQCWDSECSYNTQVPGDQLVNVTLDDLGIGGDTWFVRRVLGGGGRGGEDATDIGVADDSLASWLSEHESVLYKLQKCGSKGSSC
ncbi:glycoside hydrolase [Jackrogersella minutella]|nr:glycoside hydrolase [Jackrogersella minutella]